jgi:UDP-N-acetylmuramoyl-tripeptide--D-alanyl-D-alanine ligase
MIKVCIKEIANFLDAVLFGDPNLEITEVTTDSRKITQGVMFVALKGERFDGHNFVQSAISLGAKAIVVDHHIDVDDSVVQLVVKDTRIALGKLGLLNRKKSKARVCAITGTCGKTTVKEMVASILSTMGNTLATKGNLNNDIGVPLTLLDISEKTDYAVIEMGANHLNEIEYSVNLACPECAVINNVGAAHLEGFKSLDGVYKAKSEILDYILKTNGIGVINADDAFYKRWIEDYNDMKFLSFGISQNANVHAYNISYNNVGCSTFNFKIQPDKLNKNNQIIEGKVTLNLIGEHNVLNALCSISLAYLLGAQTENIIKGLELVKPVCGRLNLLDFGKLKLIDDAYNASFSAVKASIDTLSHMQGIKIFAFGDMGELGDYAQDIHKDVGKYAIDKIDYLLTVGELANLSAIEFDQQGNKAQSFSNKQSLCLRIEELLNSTEESVYVAVKGSHAMNMQEIVNFLSNNYRK